MIFEINNDDFEKKNIIYDFTTKKKRLETSNFKFKIGNDKINDNKSTVYSKGQRTKKKIIN